MAIDFTCLTHHWSSHGTQSQKLNLTEHGNIIPSMPKRGNLIQYCVETWQFDPMLWQNVATDLAGCGSAIPIQTITVTFQNTSLWSYIYIMIFRLRHSSISVTTSVIIFATFICIQVSQWSKNMQTSHSHEIKTITYAKIT